MTVAWVVNNIFPEVIELINRGRFNKVSVSNSWTSALFEGIQQESDISLVVIMFYQGDELIKEEKNNIIYYVLPRKKNPFSYDKMLNSYLRQVNEQMRPDVVHIHGTEYPHVVNAIEVFGKNKVVLSIQGMVSIIQRYYLSSIKLKEIFQNLTIRNLIFRDSILGQQKMFRKRGEHEINAISNANYIIGRTDWDYVHSTSINPSIKYFHLDETLRTDFFKSRKWNYNSCTKHTIFISQSSYPIKGLHMMLKALAIVKKCYPDVILRIAGKEFLKHDTLRDKLAYSGYAKYINKIIKENGLENNIQFTGPLDAKGMINEYLSSNVYVGPSCIENSPNSMCEAQLLGVPAIISNVGGVYEMTDCGQTAILYRFEEYEMLAYYIRMIFETPYLQESKIQKGIKLAENRHNCQTIISKLLDVYKQIAND